MTNDKATAACSAALSSAGLAVARAEFEQKFHVPNGVVFSEWDGGGGYVCDRSKYIPGSVPLAEEFNRYWCGWISAWRTLTANAELRGGDSRPA